MLSENHKSLNALDTLSSCLSLSGFKNLTLEKEIPVNSENFVVNIFGTMASPSWSPCSQLSSVWIVYRFTLNESPAKN